MGNSCIENPPEPTFVSGLQFYCKEEHHDKSVEIYKHSDIFIYKSIEYF